MSTLEECIAQLNQVDEAERIFAAEDIGYLNMAGGVPPLLKRLGTESSRAVRDSIFQALARIDDESAIEGAVCLLKSDNPEIRNQAVDVLQRKGAKSIPFLNTAMRVGDRDLRKLVLDVLAGVRAREADEIYRMALADRDLNVVITAVENLGKLREYQFRTGIEELLQPDSHPMLAAACMEALVSIGDESSLEAIRSRLGDLAGLPDFLLASCLKVIAVRGTAKEFAEAAGLLAVRGPHLRLAILNALTSIHSRCPSADASESLLAAVKSVIEDQDPPPWRYQAVRLLGLWGERDDIYAFLVSCLSNPERLVRLGAAESLRATRRPGFEGALAARSLTETDGGVLEALKC
jgi:HEAT repeat protein